MKKILVVGSLNMDLVVRVQNLPKLGETILGDAFYENPGGKGANQAVAAVARELCCFIWGMMTGNYSRTAQAEASVYRSELD